MMSFSFPGANVTMTKPDNMTDEQCASIAAYVGTDNEGLPFVLTAYLLSIEDLAAVNAGRPIMLKMVGRSMRPVALYTYDENEAPNV